MKISDIQVTAIHPERWGDDLDVVNAARVSFHKEAKWLATGQDHIIHADGGSEIIPFKELDPKDEKLINYLAKHKHFSPFNHSFCSFRVKAPIFVARQLVKHKFMPWNEVSRRYVDEEPEFYSPEEFRGKADNVKQGSDEDKIILGIVHKDIGTNEVWTTDIHNSFQLYCNQCLSMYEDMLNAGVCAEQARMVLPQNMMTEWIWSGTLGAFCDMLVLRLDPHTQYESRIVAQQIKEHIEKVFPVSLKARLENA